MATPSSQRPRSYDGDYMDDCRKAESAVQSFLTWNENITDVQDVREVKEYQSKDIDFLASYKAGPFGKLPLAIEAKADKHLGKTGNVLFEVFRAYLEVKAESLLRTGWSWHSEADCFCMWGTSTRLLYVVPAYELRAGLQRALVAERELKTSQVQTDKNTITYLLLIPEKYVVFQVFSHDLDANAWSFVRTNTPDVLALPAPVDKAA